MYSFAKSEGHLYAADGSRVPFWASLIAVGSGFGCGWFVSLLVIAVLNLLFFRSSIPRRHWLGRIPLAAYALAHAGLLAGTSMVFHLITWAPDRAMERLWIHVWQTLVFLVIGSIIPATCELGRMLLS